jgi:ubiquinone/menaquinone biosynthesis C-methylase UbiE
MNQQPDSERKTLREYHEHHMHEGQARYFTLQEGDLQATPQQRTWLNIHLRKARRLLDLRPTERFLDLGCGEGYFTLPLAQEAGQTLGLDFTGAALYALREQPASRIPTLQVAAAAGEQLPLSQDSFDKALCNHMLEHVLDDDAVIQELYRVLRPGGRVLIGVPLALAPQIQFALRLWRLLRPDARRLQLESVIPGQLVPDLIGKQSHIRFYSLQSVRNLLERHSFKVLKAKGVGFAWRGPLASYCRSNPLLLNLGTLAAHIMPALADGILVLAEKV